MAYSLSLLLCCVVFHSVCSQETFNEDDSVFVPTNEWQIVRPGQHLPAGLHIRQSLKTGLTEAKLFDGNGQSDSQYPAVLLTDRLSGQSDERKIVFQPLNESLHLTFVPEEEYQTNIEQVKPKFRTYEQLKAEFEALKLSVKSDLEILEDLMKQLNSINDTENILTVLEDLSYLLHQVDNGQHFADRSGFLLLHKFLYHSNNSVKMATLSVMSAAIQGNSHVKIIALQSGVLDVLHSLLQSVEVSADSPGESVKVLSSGLTTLGALLRDFPSAQKYFFRSPTESLPGLSGFDLLSKLFTHNITLDNHQALLNLRIRIITLLGDIALERTNAHTQAQTTLDGKDDKLWKLYAEIAYEDLLKQTSWCAHSRHLLLNELQSGVPESQLNHTAVDHDRREKILSSALRLFPTCRHSLSDSNVESLLQSLEHEYFLRSRTRDGPFDFVFTDLHSLVISLRRLIGETSDLTDRVSNEL